MVVDDVEDVEEEPAPRRSRAVPANDEDDDDDDVDPDDVEEDLDTILKDRIAAGADDDDEDDEEAPVDDRTDGGDRVAPRAAEEFSCNECFLLVRRSQFSAKRTDCPGGLDGDGLPGQEGARASPEPSDRAGPGPVIAGTGRRCTNMGR